MSELPTGIVTFLMTDVEGSTRLWEGNPEAMRDALAAHDALAARVITDEGGTLLKTRGEGDSLFAAFRAATEAASAALNLQRAFYSQGWAVPLRVRFAIHSGEADLRDGDYTGLTVNRCARLRAIAYGGQVLLSEAAAHLAQDALPSGASLRDLGNHRLRDLRRPEQVYALRHPDLPDDFPPPLSVDSLPNNLPRQLTSFIGRERELAEVRTYLVAHRLVTIFGTGGTGKTRLALQAAAEMLEEYPQGLWLVEFAPVSDPALVPSTALATLGLREEAGRTILQTLTAFLGAKRVLLILDNCEHLVQPCAELADALTHACPNVHILATSREALTVAGELIYPLGALSLPTVGQGATNEVQGRAESVRLFAERAALSRPGFTLTPENTPSIAALCRQIDGLPLAIELAAARLRGMSVQSLHSQLRRHFHLLSHGSRTVSPRQQTLETLMDWSYQLLSEEEAHLFARLSVFSGGWTAEAAEAICGGSEADSLTLLLLLVEKSLVLAEDWETETRYRLLETMRQYAADRLTEHGDGEVWRERHRDYYLAFAERIAPELRGPKQASGLNQIEAEYGNLREALAWSAGGIAQLQIGCAVHNFWYVRGFWKEGRQWLEAALSSDFPADDGLRAQGLIRAGVLAWAEKDYPAANAYYRQCLAIRERLGDQEGIVVVLSNLGIVAEEEKKNEKAKSFLEQALEVSRQLGLKSRIANALNSLGGVLNNLSQTEAARTALEESVALYEEIGEQSGLASALYNLGIVALRQGRGTEGLTNFCRKLPIERDLKRHQGVFYALQGIAMALSGQQRYLEAAQAFGALEEYRRVHTESIRSYETDEDEHHYQETTRAALGEQGYAQSQASGNKLSLDNILALCQV